MRWPSWVSSAASSLRHWRMTCSPDDHTLVLSFFAVLTAAIVAVAWFKTWTELNLLGFYFTFMLTAFWLLFYPNDDWAYLQPFIALLTAMYIALPTLFAMREVPDITRTRTAQIVFTAPFATLGLQYLLVGHTEHGIAVSASVLAVAHVLLAIIIRRGRRNAPAHDRRYRRAEMGTGVLRYPMTPPSRTGNPSRWSPAATATTNCPWSTTAWPSPFPPSRYPSLRLPSVWPPTTPPSCGLCKAYCCSGPAVVATACSQSSEVFCYNSLAYISFSVYLVNLPSNASFALPIVNERFLGAAVLAGASLLSGWMLYRSSDHLIFVDDLKGWRCERRNPAHCERPRRDRRDWNPVVDSNDLGDFLVVVGWVD